ncbi:MAG: hypothetical protein H6564_16380 [Lewinellaceae bacterium]|nr:hypothetical protein [Lewinellaceae bacterium]
MKALLPLALIICCLQPCTAQVVFDSTLAENYSARLRCLPDKHRESILKLEEQLVEENNGGLVLLSLISQDTLHKDSLRFEEPSSSVRIVDSWVPGFESSRAEETSAFDAPALFIGGAEIIGDTLIITASDIFNRTITHLVYGDSVKAMYTERYDGEYILKRQEHDALADEVTVPVIIRAFSLNTPDYLGQPLLYGAAELESEPFFVKAGPESDVMLRVKWRFRYVFKIRVH